MRRSEGEPLQPGNAKGTGRFINLEGTMSSDKYKAVLQIHLLPTMQRDFSDGDGIFQQDLAPCHTPRKMRTFFEENGFIHAKFFACKNTECTVFVHIFCS